MIASQLSIFAENKPGKLAEVTGILAGEKINIRATAISTSDTFGVIHLIVDDPERALAALTKAGVLVKIRRVLAVLLDDRPGGLDKLAQLLAREGININNAYGFVLENRVRAVFVVDVDDPEKAVKIIEKKGFKTLDTEALAAVEPFHYMKY
ncbi:MAG TPA: ACT domain-containing protein [Syntrophales bacterium]|nr:ACT domain-containing protein [Syntrophales bacterium]HON23379.1 ACT domain-containing protein [Syntrophales bacterium]HPC32869.1 ACT domain-containing protein [Syntrophales bacterium]HQI35909.1 ACT domain-containing protein [Syntrophales bacterium]HRR47330.1 ACT domain-containing protein [Syntrophales bacterium]